MSLMPTPLIQEVVSRWSSLSLQELPTIPLITSVLLASVLYLTCVRSRNDGDMCQLGGLSILNAWSFFQNRYDFLKSNFSKTGQNFFCFKVLHHSVIAMKGEGARRAFFDSGELGFVEGYKILLGGAPKLTDIDAPVKNHENLAFFRTQLLAILDKDRIAYLVPQLIDGIQMRFESWGVEGRMDPFKNIYEIVFQLTVHIASCRELAANAELLKQLQHDYWIIEKSATPTALLLPWLPVPSKRNKINATRNLYVALRKYVDERVNSVAGSDAIDILLARGIVPEEVVGIITGIIFAGTVNTGVNTCWSLLFLTFHMEWRKKVIAEINTLIELHSNGDESDPFHKRLASIPIPAWEEQMPMLDLALHETLRLTKNGAAIRRNIGPAVNLAGKSIPRGYFLTYPMFDVHHDPEIYTNPDIFDPARFLPGREEGKKEKYAFLAWGAGRHQCAGMRMAKLEMKIFLAFFIAAYEYDIVDSEGGFLTRLPQPDYNDIHMVRPTGDPCYINFKRVVN